MNDDNPQKEFKKKYFSDNEKMSDFSEYIHRNKKKIKNIISKLPNPKDFPSSMSDGRLFQKFAIEYIKNILFKNYNYSFSENIPFNFFQYVQTFTESDHSKLQNEIFHDIISLKDEKANSPDYMFSGDFDMVINSISSNDVKRAMNKFKFNIYQYPGCSIQDNANYCIIGEIKKDFYDEIKKDEIKKQFNKYVKIFQLLSSKPNLYKLKKRIGINETNNLLFVVVTDGNFYNFEYMRHIRKKFQEDIHSDRDLDQLPNYFKIFDIISSIIPLLLIFVPRTLDDNKGLYISQGIQKTILDLKNEIKNLRDNQKKMEQNQKEMEQKIALLLGKKRIKKKIVDEKEEEYEEKEESEEEEESKGEEKSKKKKERKGEEKSTKKKESKEEEESKKKKKKKSDKK